MAQRRDIHKVLLIGSGPAVIGQAAEFDYACSQACSALRSLGYDVGCLSIRTRQPLRRTRLWRIRRI